MRIKNYKKVGMLDVWKKKKDKSENKYITNDLRHVRVNFCVCKEIDDIFSIYLNEFVGKSDFKTFEHALLNIEFEDINQVIKILELNIEGSNLSKSKQEQSYNYWFFLTSGMIAIFILLLDKTLDTNVYIWGLFLILSTLIMRELMMKRYYINPFDMAPLFYKHCIEILEKKQKLETEEQIEKKRISKILIESN